MSWWVWAIPAGWLVVGFALAVPTFAGQWIETEPEPPDWIDLVGCAALASVFGPLTFIPPTPWLDGLRYLTTDWDPWEGSSPSIRSSAPNGYEDDAEHEVVEGSDVLVGHRLWRLFEDERGPVLASTIVDHTYTGPICRCEREDIEQGRGLFAAKPDRPFYREPRPEYVVEGEVELFGRVVEGEKGYRAEKLRIRSLTLRPGGWHPAPTVQKTAMFHAGPYPVSGVTRSFCSCCEAERPWPHPYTEIVEALSDRYRCDVSYAPRDGEQVFAGGCGQPFASWSSIQTLQGFTYELGSEPEPIEREHIVKPDDLIEKPTTEDIQQYGRA